MVADQDRGGVRLQPGLRPRRRARRRDNRAEPAGLTPWAAPQASVLPGCPASQPAPNWRQGQCVARRAVRDGHGVVWTLFHVPARLQLPAGTNSRGFWPGIVPRHESNTTPLPDGPLTQFQRGRNGISRYCHMGPMNFPWGSPAGSVAAGSDATRCPGTIQWRRRGGAAGLSAPPRRQPRPPTVPVRARRSSRARHLRRPRWPP